MSARTKRIRVTDRTIAKREFDEDQVASLIKCTVVLLRDGSTMSLGDVITAFCYAWKRLPRIDDLREL